MPIDSLKPGMVVAKAIYDADGHILLNKGVVIKQSYIRHLKMLKVPAVYITDKYLGDVEVPDVVNEQTRLKAVKIIKNVFNDQSQEKRHIPLLTDSSIQQVVNTIIEDLLDQNSLMINLSDIRTMDDYTFAHSVNVCILALLTGITLNYSRAALKLLGIGALLHDIGKVCIPLNILNKPGKLTPKEYKEICRHAELGYEMLRQQKGISQVSAQVALQHHERYDGSGYPQGLKGEDIHEFARITGVVDVFDALTADRIYRPAFPNYEAYEMLAAAGNFTHDYKIVEAFLYNIAVYPVGTLVKLNSGDIAVVIGTRRGQSYRPKVKLLFNDSGKAFKKKTIIDLAEELKYSVVRVLSEEEMPDYNINKQGVGYNAYL